MLLIFLNLSIDMKIKRAVRPLIPIFSILTFTITSNISAQIDTSWNRKPEIEINGMLDTFYGYNLSKPKAVGSITTSLAIKFLEIFST